MSQNAERFSAPPRPSFRDLSVKVVRRDAALKTLCILENGRGSPPWDVVGRFNRDSRK
jgi:hypothetical protein